MMLHANFIIVCLAWAASVGCDDTLAYDIIRNLDESVGPCDDFYRFSCGGWIDRQVIPDDRASVTVRSVIQDDLYNKLRDLVEKMPEGKEAPFYTNLRNLYKSCMNSSEIESFASELLRTIRELGGWPLLEGDSWDRTNFDFIDTLVRIRKAGFFQNVIISLSVVPDNRDNTHHVIALDQGFLGMPDESLYSRGLNDSTVQAYYELMTKSAVMLGADRGQAEKDMLEALAFEAKLANLSILDGERPKKSSLNNLMTIKEIEKLAPNIDWTRLLNSLLNDPILSNESILVRNPSFITGIDKLLRETDKRILSNYMVWRVISQTFLTPDEKWWEFAREYIEVFIGEDLGEPRWKHCLSRVTDFLGIALSSLYVKNHFKKEAKHMASEMVDYIQKEFLKTLDEIDWMDRKTTELAREKALAIVPYIGYPDELLDDKKVGNHFADVSVTGGSYFTNARILTKWSNDFFFNRLRKPDLKGEWWKHAQVANLNSHYNALENSIEFPAGLFQGSLFSKDRPNYLNFGAIGSFIGQGITHGFDEKGKQFDQDGHNKNWWSDGTEKKYQKRAQCFIEQFGNYTVHENSLPINRIYVQAKNIADIGGLKLAFRAYKTWEKDHGKEPQLPGLEYSNDQLFWIGAANAYCGKYRPDLKSAVSSDPHFNPRFRVNGPLSNIEEFSRSFKCPPGSPMNPVKKCHVW